MLCLVYKVGVARCPRFRCIVDEWWGFTYHQNKEPLCDLQHNYWGCKISNFSVLELGTFPTSSQVISFSSVQSFSRVWLFATPWTAARQASLSITNSWSLPKHMFIESWCHPATSSSVVPFSSCPMSQLFSNESTLRMRWPKYWSFSFIISPSNEHPGLICFRMDWLDLLAVQGTLQHHTSKAPILQRSAFFTVQLSHPYMTTRKTIALTRQTFVGKVMSLLFNTLSRLVIAFLPRSKRLLISWLQSPPAVILEPKKIKSVTLSIVSPSICHEVIDFFTLLFHFHQEALQFLFTFCHKGGIICVYEVIDIFPAILIPACASSSPAFDMMYSAYKLNKQGDNMQPWHTPCPIWNQSIVPCPVLAVASWPAYRFLMRQVRWSGLKT